MLYKVGDKVRIKSKEEMCLTRGVKLEEDAYFNKCGTYYFSRSMHYLFNCVVKIKKIRDTTAYEIHEGGNSWYLEDWMIRCLVLEPNETIYEAELDEQTITMELTGNDNAIALIKFLTILEFDIEVESVGECYKIEAKRGKE